MTKSSVRVAQDNTAASTPKPGLPRFNPNTREFMLSGTIIFSAKNLVEPFRFNGTGQPKYTITLELDAESRVVAEEALGFVLNANIGIPLGPIAEMLKGFEAYSKENAPTNPVSNGYKVEGTVNLKRAAASSNGRVIPPPPVYPHNSVNPKDIMTPEAVLANVVQGSFVRVKGTVSCSKVKLAVGANPYYQFGLDAVQLLGGPKISDFFTAEQDEETGDAGLDDMPF